MARISELSDELLIMILSFLPTKVAVSTSILSKQWKFLWMWSPNLENIDNDIDIDIKPRYWNSVVKNLPLHRAPVIESLLLSSCHHELLQLENIKLWVGIAVSRCVRELSEKILVDVPGTVYFPFLKTLHLRCVTYLNEDSLRVLLSYCHVLQDLCIERDKDDDNVGKIVVNIKSLQRLSLQVDVPNSLNVPNSSDRYVIVTPSLKYFKFEDLRDNISYSIKRMPMLEEADINVEHQIQEFLKSITSVKHLSLRPLFTSAEEHEHLKLRIFSEDWSKLLVWLLRNFPKLRILNLDVDRFQRFDDYEPVNWKNKRSSVPECLWRSLETLVFA